MGIRYLTRLRLGLSHFNDHKFRHNFQDCLNHYVLVVLKLSKLFIIACIAIIIMTFVKPY